MKDFYVYMLASGRNGTIYTGVTSDILRRISEHREEISKGFTSRYGVKRLVWYEVHSEARNAIQREKNIKHWSRAWKIAPIEETNPAWKDLFESLLRESCEERRRLRGYWIAGSRTDVRPGNDIRF
ncbi:MAG: hypothetical protein AMXMBFR74_11800 [Parvibaculum sp.]|jgi:putative endonuclease|uniref:GIY-YIG nuclease family protein n=1 Tax=Parvibaculum sp. TaxID=2024848 RepID=UPI0035B70F2C